VREENNVAEQVRKRKAEIMALLSTLLVNATTFEDAAIMRAIAPIEAKIEPDIEAAINEYKTKLEKLKTMTERMIKSGNNFDKAILADEILLALRNESGDVISRNIDKYSQEFLREYQDIKTDFINVLDEITRKAQRNYVAKFSLEAERKILEVGARLKSMREEFEENYYPAYNTAKSYLRETRQNLRDLARRTMIDARDLKDLLEDPKSNDPVLFNIYVKRMKDLRIDPAVLKEALERYNSAMLTFENTKSYITKQMLSLDEMSESGKQFKKTIKVLTDILKEEIDQIETWITCVEGVRSSLDRYSEEKLRETKVYKIIFIKRLGYLKNAADTFLAQPSNIIIST